MDKINTSPNVQIGERKVYLYQKLDKKKRKIREKMSANSKNFRETLNAMAKRKMVKALCER